MRENQLFSMDSSVNTVGYRDHLTQLANRRAFEQKIKEFIVHGTRERFALLFMDLDHFKMINDTFGHAVGDQVLFTVAQRFQQISTPPAFLARLGGDEFVVLYPFKEEQQVAQLAEKLLATMRQPIELPLGEVAVQMSIGASFYPEDGTTREDLLAHADQALYRAKEEARQTIQYYRDTEDREQPVQDDVLQHIKRAFEKNEFQLVYEPQFCVESGVEVGVEVHIVTQREQMPIWPEIERTPLAIPVERWLMERVLRNEQRIEGERQVTIPVSLQYLKHPYFLEELYDVLQRFQANPQQITIDLPEEALSKAHGVEVAIRTVANWGMRVRIRQYGAGESSVMQLQLLPIHQIQLAHLLVEESMLKVGKSICRLAACLQIEVVAPRISNQEQFEQVNLLGCEIVSGPHFSESYFMSTKP